mmetsp:Transcript_2265/g.5050  ORF Transcript_2265/g.5050 Transcript_2265/m.5050 type:complete len:291 (+) Transcript_2265:114-986(+)
MAIRERSFRPPCQSSPSTSFTHCNPATSSATDPNQCPLPPTSHHRVAASAHIASSPPNLSNVELLDGPTLCFRRSASVSRCCNEASVVMFSLRLYSRLVWCRCFSARCAANLSAFRWPFVFSRSNSALSRRSSSHIALFSRRSASKSLSSCNALRMISCFAECCLLTISICRRSSSCKRIWCSSSIRSVSATRFTMKGELDILCFHLDSFFVLLSIALFLSRAFSDCSFCLTRSRCMNFLDMICADCARANARFESIGPCGFRSSGERPRLSISCASAASRDRIGLCGRS